jgi:formamidopyrimidine-DNA glycosylase
VRPTRRVRTLTAAERERLHRAARAVLTEAIDCGGTSFSHFLQVDGTLGNYWTQRKVYDRTGEPCRQCTTPIKKIRVAGRGTHYCSSCQR